MLVKIMSLRNEVTRKQGDDVCIEPALLETMIDKDHKSLEDVTAMAGKEIMMIKYSPIHDALDLLHIERCRIHPNMEIKPLSPVVLVHAWDR